MHRQSRFNPPRYPLGRAGLALAAGGGLAALVAIEFHPGASVPAASASPKMISAHEVPADLGPSLIGFGSVRDGTTMIVDHKEVRLWGIDLVRSCPLVSSRAARHLAALIETAAVVCTGLVATDGGLVGRCGSGRVTDLSQQMVFDGYALDDARTSGGMYADEQAQAAATGHGLWQAEGASAPRLDRACD